MGPNATRDTQGVAGAWLYPDRVRYNTTEQLEQIHRRLRALLFGPKDTPYYVWCEKYADWEQLIFEGDLINFRLRDRHLKKPYTDPKKGPMLDHMLVCDVVNQPVQEGMRKTIDFMLGWDDLLSESFHLGEPAIKVYTYHASSSDHSLRGSHAMRLPTTWIGNGARHFEPFEPYPKYRMWLTMTMTDEWKLATSSLPDGKGVDNLHLIAHDPRMPRYAITKNRELCGWKVGGEGGPPLRDDFASREDAKEYADDARATTYARRARREHVAAQSAWAQWLAKSGGCASPPVMPDNFDPVDSPENVYKDAKKWKMGELQAAERDQSTAVVSVVV